MCFYQSNLPHLQDIFIFSISENILVFLGELDCQDASDELTRTDFEGSCPREKGMECDEHLCGQSGFFPCGDGQCAIPYGFTEVLAVWIVENKISFVCSTLRDLAFQCEIHHPLPFWTLENGFCVWFPHSWSGPENETTKRECDFFLKCQLSRNLSTLCTATDIDSVLISTLCKAFLHSIRYPPGALISPLIYTYYKVDRQLADGLLPDYVYIEGRLRCAGFHLNITGFGSSISNLEMMAITMSSVVDRQLCRLAVTRESESSFIRNHSVFAPHYDMSCWHDWLQFFNFSAVEEAAASCKELCLSPHRIHNDVPDCDFDSLDETSIARPIKRYNNHCLHCITHEQQAVCIPVGYIGFESFSCARGENTYSTETSVLIKTVKCDDKDASECHIVRSYFMQSSIDKANMTVTTPFFFFAKVPRFSQYCDTYFDTETGTDEAVEHCLNKWACADNQYRCLTGQCIAFDWLCDGKRDFSTVIVIFIHEYI
jgi:hypothetical protein